MDYEFQNLALLQKLHDLLKSFPFNQESEKEINKINVDLIVKVYSPFSDIENDSIANAICWNARTLDSLLKKYPVRALDEVISFSESILNNKG